MRLNLNTVDYSHNPTLELLVSLNELRNSSYEATSDSDRYDYDDKAEDIWSILYNKRKADEEQFAPVAELFELADIGQLSNDDLECLREGFLP